MKITLEGKVAIVTGASRGIGLAVAKTFLENGAQVALVARKVETLAEAKASLGDLGKNALTIPLHVGRDGASQEIVARTVEAFGRVDVVVNNAATNPHFGPAVTADEKVFDKTFETNARAYFLLAKEAATLMIDRDIKGSLIFVSSTQGILGSPLMGIYGMTKAAVLSLTKTLAIELGPSGIRSNAIAPGLVDTRFAAALTSNDDISKRWVDRAPLRRWGNPSEIAGAALYLASDASSYVTGTTLVVDGGYCIAAT